MVRAAGAADCAQDDGTYVRQKNMTAIYKLLSVNPGMETGSADFINGKVDQFHLGVELTDHC